MPFFTILFLTLFTPAFGLPHQSRPSDASYAQGYYLENRNDHTQHAALDRQVRHDARFFEESRHPTLATETLEGSHQPDRSPSSSSSFSAVVAQPTNTTETPPSDVDDCPDPEEPSSTEPLSSPAPTSNHSEGTQSESLPVPTPSQAFELIDTGLRGIIGRIFSGGIATFFFQNGVAGNCGTVHQDSDKVVALQTATYAGGAHCGKRIMIEDTRTGKTAVGTVADSCPTCLNPESIDLSHSLFNEFAQDADGIFNVKWGFLD